MADGLYFGYLISIICGSGFAIIAFVFALKTKKIIFKGRFAKGWNVVFIILGYSILWYMISLFSLLQGNDYIFSISVSGNLFSTGLFSLISVYIVYFIYGQLRHRYEDQATYNDQLLKASQFKTEFMSTMSHELRTPLNAVIGFSDLLLEGLYGNLNNDQLKFVKDISDSASHLLDLINQVLDISKIESGKMHLNVRRVNLNEMLEQINASTKLAIENKNVKIVTTGFDEPRNIFADPVRMREILLNLIGNAVKFTMQGFITISFKENQYYFEIGVSDTGIGISPKDFGRIFKEFEHIEKPEGMNVPGTGLGLPLTKRLVELHGGQLSFTSELGKGTAFIIRLPKKLEKQVVDTFTPSGTEDAEGKKIPVYSILLIEDDRKDALMVKTIIDSITSFQNRFYLASTLQKGLEYLDQCDINIILLDLILPDSRDMNTVKIVLGRKPNVPVIILTRTDDMDLAMEIVKKGAQDYLIKTELTAQLLEHVIKFSVVRQKRIPKS
jgi:signal transduction histidine kinase/ActR/RegA family two-component response regulator